MKAGGFAQWARRHIPTDGRVFIAKSAFERHHNISAAANVFRQSMQQTVARKIQRRNHNPLVAGEIRALGENKIYTDICSVENVVHLPKDRTVVHSIAELHELDTVVRIVAVKDGNLIFALEVCDFRPDSL